MQWNCLIEMIEDVELLASAHEFGPSQVCLQMDQELDCTILHADD